MWWDHSAGRGLLCMALHVFWIKTPLPLWSQKLYVIVISCLGVHINCDYINRKEWRGCLCFTGLWNFLLFCLSGILVSYFFGWYETFFGGEVGCLLPLALYKFSWCWGWYREVRPCDGACLNTVPFEINEALASWLINVCGGE